MMRQGRSTCDRTWESSVPDSSILPSKLVLGQRAVTAFVSIAGRVTSRTQKLFFRSTTGIGRRDWVTRNFRRPKAADRV